jgi:transposase-like protein
MGVKMENYQEMRFFEFQEAFQTEKQCFEHLKKIRWGDGFQCPRCGYTEAYFLEERKIFQCKHCRYHASLTAKTMFHRSHLPLRKWFWAIYLVGTDKRGCPATLLERYLEVDYKTAWLMIHKIRAAFKDRDATYMLESVIEMDDAFFGGSAAGKRGRGADNKTTVIVSVENRGKMAGFAKMTTVETLDSITVKTFAQKTARKGSTIRTDGYSSYRVLGKYYAHEGKTVAPKDAPLMLPWVHRLIGNAKTFLCGTYHGVSHKHLQRYLDEFCYRFNRRFNRSSILDRILTAAISAPIVTFADLTQ